MFCSRITNDQNIQKLSTLSRKIDGFECCPLYLEKQMDSNVVSFISKNRWTRKLSTSSRKINEFECCQLHLEKQMDSNVVNFISKNRWIRMLSTSSRKIDGFECFGRVRNYYEIISRKFQNSQNFQNNAIKDVKQISSNGVIIIFYHVVLSVYFEKQYYSVF